MLSLARAVLTSGLCLMEQVGYVVVLCKGSMMMEPMLLVYPALIFV